MTNDWSIWFGLLSLAGLVVFSALNLALRMPRARANEHFQISDRLETIEAIAERRPRYMLATAILRSASIFLLFFSTLRLFLVHGGLQQSRDIAVACLTAWALLLMLGIAIPYAWAKYRGEWLLQRLLPLLRISLIICWPFMLVVDVIDPLVRRLCGLGPQDAQSHADAFEREILDVVNEGEIHGAVDELEKEMIESVMSLGETRVQGIMTPRTDVVALPVDADIDTVRETIRRHGHSRIPVYDGTIDTILGVLYVKDILRRGDEQPFTLRAMMRKALFIPESKLVRDLLREFQTQKIHLAIVLDEYGGTAGLVSVEDILEELVGELADEYEIPEPPAFKQIDESTFEVDGRVRIDEINDRLEVQIPESQDYETIGGFVSTSMGKIPKVGEHYDYENVSIEVIGADPRRITRLLLKITREETSREPEHSAV